MKTFHLRDLDTVLVSFTGESITDGDRPFTLADAFMKLLSQTQKDGKDGYALYDVGMQIFRAEGAPVRLQQRSFELLEEACRTTPFTIAVSVPLSRCLEDARSRAEREPDQEQEAEAPTGN
ncbi:MAG: hypothetical protein CL480_11075 [Acidobacteria bacterium]|nr:hypothetical protein [Acidobacteriota bacterium]|tara:strand:+ start:711 stop:1073 length:363 start_codon:yes stop_codon:yes gene_type:complete